MDIVIRNEKKEEQFIVEKVIRESFWDVYKPGCDEHLMVNQLHQSKDFIPELDFVAECEGKIVGNIVCSYCRVVNDNDQVENCKDVIAIGPLGVLPEYQNKGIGRLLIEEVKRKSAEMGISGIVLYGNPQYYNRFGFIDAKEYIISTPDGENFEFFMALETFPESLSLISGRCFESSAFEIDQEVLKEFEKRFIERKINYSVIEEEFAKNGKQLPLTENEKIGLTLEQLQEINPCGTCCGTCEDYGVVCDGCRNRNGKPIWYSLYDKMETCGYYQCCQNKGKHDCSECQQLPCNRFFQYPDPNMSDEFKQYWFKLRMENFNKLRSTDKVVIEDEFCKNYFRYGKND